MKGRLATVFHLASVHVFSLDMQPSIQDQHPMHSVYYLQHHWNIYSVCECVCVCLRDTLSLCGGITEALVQYKHTVIYIKVPRCHSLAHFPSSQACCLFSQVCNRSESCESLHWYLMVSVGYQSKYQFKTVKILTKSNKSLLLTFQNDKSPQKYHLYVWKDIKQ